MARFGRLDLLVNNAGLGQEAQGAPLTVELSDAQWDLTFQVNARGTFLCSRAAVREMLARRIGGRIVNVASTAGRQGVARYAAYSAANACPFGSPASPATVKIRFCQASPLAGGVAVDNAASASAAR